jgi:hypothetical protein
VVVGRPDEKNFVPMAFTCQTGDVIPATLHTAEGMNQSTTEKDSELKST